MSTPRPEGSEEWRVSGSNGSDDADDDDEGLSRRAPNNSARFGSVLEAGLAAGLSPELSASKASHTNNTQTERPDSIISSIQFGVSSSSF